MIEIREGGVAEQKDRGADKKIEQADIIFQDTILTF